MPGSSDDSQPDPDAAASGGPARRRPGLVWLLAAVLVPALLAAFLLALRTGPTEDDLRQRSLAALEAKGITGVRVDFSGRDATVVVPPGANPDEAREVVADVDGVRIVKAAGSGTAQAAATPSASISSPVVTASASPTLSATPAVSASPAPSPTDSDTPTVSASPTASDSPTTSDSPTPTPSESPTESPTGSESPAVVAVAPFSVSRTDTTVSVQAVVRDQAAKDAVLADARLFLDEGETVEDKLTVDPTTGIANHGALISLLRALSTATGEATVKYDGSTVTLTGQVADQATKATAARSAAAAVPGAVVANQLRVPQSPRPPVSPACQVFEAQLVRWRATNKIGFVSGSELMTDQSRVAVVRVAALLRGCDTVRVEVAGHTDNLGDPRTSQPLSERRAEAVKAELVRLGVPAGRITARGYGESRPIASNSTFAGRVANRRVEIQVTG